MSHGKEPCKALATKAARTADCLGVESCSEPELSNSDEANATFLKPGTLEVPWGLTPAETEETLSHGAPPLEVLGSGGCDTCSLLSLELFDSYEQTVDRLNKQILLPLFESGQPQDRCQLGWHPWHLLEQASGGQGSPQTRLSYV